MKNFMDKIKDFFDIRKKGMRLVSFNVIVVIALLGCLFSVALALASFLPLQPVPILIAAILIASFPFYLANYRGKLVLASNVMVVAVCFILFPAVFFVRGGIESGMSSWFALGILFIFLLLDGVNFVLMLSLDAIVVAGCYWISYRFPQLVQGHMLRSSFFLDMVQGIFTTTLAVGMILKVQAWIQKQQGNVLEEKNKQLLEMTQKAKRAQRDAEVANHSKSNFLANMSHEIRTPINTVLGMNEMILRQTTEENTRSLAQDIRTSTESLLEIVNEILDFSRIESGKMQLMEDDYELQDVLHDTATAFDLRAKEKGLYLHLDIDEQLPSMYRGDSLRLRQIINNIMSNAIKYTREGGIRFSVSGYQEEDSEILHFEIEDTGVGIREEDMQRLFEAFERIDEKSNRNIEGTGLGMAITANLLDMMGTTLQVKSTFGEGTMFCFDLKQRVKDWTPMGIFEAQERKDDSNQKQEFTFIAPDISILLVDDNAMNRKVFCKLLKHTQMQIDEADNGFTCLEMVKKKHYDLIFLDHMMPELDGVETFSYMQSMQENLCKDTPVIVLTANAIIGAKEQYLKIGFRDYLSKPIDPRLLENLIVEQLLLQNINVETVPIQKNHMELYEDKKPEEKQELPQIEGFDWAYGLLHFPNAQMLWESVEDFYKECESAMQEMNLLYEEIDSEQGLDKYRIHVHALKSNLALIGAMQASALAKILEYAARDGLRDRVRQFHGVCMDEVEQCYRNLMPHFHQDTKKEKMTDASWIQGILAMLRNSAEELHYDGVDQMMQMLDGYVYEDDLQGQMEQLYSAVRNLDLEKVVKLCDLMEENVRKESGKLDM